MIDRIWDSLSWHFEWYCENHEPIRQLEAKPAASAAFRDACRIDSRQKIVQKMLRGNLGEGKIGCA